MYAHRTLRVQQPPAEEEGDPSNAIVDFCSLYIAAVKIPVMMMHQRLCNLQNVYFCALGYHPQFGHSELKRFLHRYLMMSNHPSNDNNTDTALHKTLQSFITSM